MNNLPNNPQSYRHKQTGTIGYTYTEYPDWQSIAKVLDAAGHEWEEIQYQNNIGDVSSLDAICYCDFPLIITEFPDDWEPVDLTNKEPTE